ncbi:MAG: DNA/RNA non-specific endonuclease, partial [Bacteroidota bacterium]
MLRLLAISVFNITFLSLLSGQSLEQQLSQLESEVQQLERSKAQLLRRMEDVKLQKLRRDLAAWGLPKLNQADQPIEHSGLSLLYDEKHEQARWVAHIIIADVLNGKLPRSNDFRPDPKVSSGSAVEADYFLKYLQADSTYKYDGFGYDRGHLAASADFNWSQEAMSDTYYYSNMAPQLADFNRGKWAELEALLRGYLYHHPQTQLYVCTGGHLEDGLPSIPRSQHKVSIPKYFWKV